LDDKESDRHRSERVTNRPVNCSRCRLDDKESDRDRSERVTNRPQDEKLI
jgi:hypothetical protein